MASTRIASKKPRPSLDRSIERMRKHLAELAVYVVAAPRHRGSECCRRGRALWPPAAWCSSTKANGRAPSYSRAHTSTMRLGKAKFDRIGITCAISGTRPVTINSTMRAVRTPKTRPLQSTCQTRSVAVLEEELA